MRWENRLPLPHPFPITDSHAESYLSGRPGDITIMARVHVPVLRSYIAMQLASYSSYLLMHDISYVFLLENHKQNSFWRKKTLVNPFQVLRAIGLGDLKRQIRNSLSLIFPAKKFPSH